MPRDGERTPARSGDLQEREPERGPSVDVPHELTGDHRSHHGLSLQKTPEDIGQLPAFQAGSAERNAGHVLVMHPGEVAEDVAGLDVAENQPGFAFVGQAIIGLDAEAA